MDKITVESLAYEGLLMVPLYMAELSWTRRITQMRMAVSRPPTLTIIICRILGHATTDGPGI